MWMSVFIVDWDWLTAFPPEERADAFSRDDSDAYREDQSAINGADLDRHELLETLFALQERSKKVEKLAGDLISTAFAPLEWRGQDDLNVGSGFTGLSPSTVARMAGALDALDLWDVARHLAEEEDEERREEFAAQDQATLEQVARIIRRARERGWGLITHYG